MSVIIPNMKMPMSCLACPLAREKFGCLLCVGFFKENLIGRRVYKIDLKESDTDFNRPDWCPLVPLPEGHGRLGDLDSLQEEFKKSHDGKRLMLIDTAPTIVPSEGSVNDGT